MIYSSKENSFFFNSVYVKSELRKRAQSGFFAELHLSLVQFQNIAVKYR